MGLFPRTVGQRFSHPDGRLLGAHPRPRLPVREDGRKEDARARSCRTLHVYPALQHVVLARMHLSRETALPRSSGRKLCGILHPDFAEPPFHALQ
jgi:hypothetical protein